MRSFQSHAIGVFDSGVGGLTVLQELNRQLPNESILYFADTARLPYGTRSPSEILQFVREIVQWMQSEKVKMIVMACNTSSALALEKVRSEANVPILGLILPGARAAVATGKRIGVIATPATAASGAYSRAIFEANSTAQVWEVGCPEFVPLIEQNRLYDPYTLQVAQNYLAPLMEKNIDTLVYGCTHYPHLAAVLKRILPPTVSFVNPAVSVATATARELELEGLKNTETVKATRFGVSGSPKRFATVSRQWLGYLPTVEKVYLQGANSTPLPLESVDPI